MLNNDVSGITPAQHNTTSPNHSMRPVGYVPSNCKECGD